MPSLAATCSSGSPTKTSASPMFGVVAVKRSTLCVPGLTPPSITLHWLASSSRMSQEWASFLASTVRSGRPSRSGMLPVEANAGLALAVVRSRLLQALASSAAATTSKTYERIATPLGGYQRGAASSMRDCCGGRRRSGVAAPQRFLVRRRVMPVALKREKRLNRADRGRVASRDPHFPAPRAIDRHVADCRAPVAHHRCAGHGLRVHLERLREVARAERRGDLAHVTANRGDRSGVGCIVALENDTATVGQVFEDVRRRVLIDALDVRSA